MALSQRARVLITVKASPEPSTTYGDTVCVAGIRLDGDAPEWIRLYPVPFRYLEEEQKFKKYEVISLDITKARKDPRPESFTPDLSSIKRETSVPIAGRANYVLPLVDRSMCEVVADIAKDINGPSLAIVRARKVAGMSFEKHGAWTAEESQRLAAWAGAPDLFGDSPKTRTLEPPRLKAYYRWTCESPECKSGHTQRLLDWELTAFQRRFANSTDAELREKVTQRFLTEMLPASRVPHFFVGNFASGPKRKSFSILGVFPTSTPSADVPLF
ncbi:MAG: hypothetical protein IT189_00035 [Microbacteriaceae bacterium]|nr:hypothetical protein [Microbacteriaceae bacterium]